MCVAIFSSLIFKLQFVGIIILTIIQWILNYSTLIQNVQGPSLVLWAMESYIF